MQEVHVVPLNWLSLDRVRVLLKRLDTRCSPLPALHILRKSLHGRLWQGSWLE